MNECRRKNGRKQQETSRPCQGGLGCRRSPVSLTQIGRPNMGWIDVAIPGVIGLLLLVAPGVFVKGSGNDEKDAAAVNKLRLCGLGLLVVAALYLFIKAASPR